MVRSGKADEIQSVRRQVAKTPPLEVKRDKKQNGKAQTNRGKTGQHNDPDVRRTGSFRSPTGAAS